MSAFPTSSLAFPGFKSDSSSTLLVDDSMVSDFYVASDYSPASSLPPLQKRSSKKSLDEARSSPYKPTVPYAQLITQAIESRADKKITLNEIYNFAMEEYEYFKSAGSGWKVF